MEIEAVGSPISEPGSVTRGLPDNDVLTVDFNPSTSACRKAGCLDLVEDPLRRGRMICGISRRIPGNMVRCPGDRGKTNREYSPYENNKRIRKGDGI
jgi:hypothetical protein